MIEAADAEEYTQSLGQIAAGAWRQIALAERLGVPEALGLTTREWVEQRLGGYVQLSLPVRQEAALELVAEGMTKKKAGDVLGISADTVRRDIERADARRGDEESFLEADLREPKRADARSEADKIAREQQKRITLWFSNVTAALDLLRPMATAPLPTEFKQALSSDDYGDLKAILAELKRRHPRQERKVA